MFTFRPCRVSSLHRAVCLNISNENVDLTDCEPHCLNSCVATVLGHELHAEASEDVGESHIK